MTYAEKKAKTLEMYVNDAIESNMTYYSDEEKEIVIQNLNNIFLDFLKEILNEQKKACAKDSKVIFETHAWSVKEKVINAILKAEVLP